MSNLGIFCGTAGGTSLIVAQAIADAFKVEEEDFINMEEDFDDVEQMLEYDVLFIGSSTWGQGDVHHEWIDPQFEIESGNIDFTGKTIALFGAGDCVKHGEHFCSALGKLYKTFTKAGANVIGFVEKNDYTYKFSLAEIDDKFCGLAIDQHNEEDKTQNRIKNWIESLQTQIKS